MRGFRGGRGALDGLGLGENALFRSGRPLALLNARLTDCPTFLSSFRYHRDYEWLSLARKEHNFCPPSTVRRRQLTALGIL